MASHGPHENGEEPGADSPEASSDETRRQLRGSSLLLTGRLIALTINFAVQVLIVRYLDKADYGAFAYGLSVVILGETIVTLGLDRGLTRFLPIYDENDRPRRMLGTLLLTTGAIAGLSLAGLVLVLGLGEQVLGTLADEPGARTVITVLLLLAPIQALDQVVVGVFSVFDRAKAIFFRRYILAPSLRLLAVLALVVSSSDATFLAVAYVAAGAIGLISYARSLRRLLRQRRVVSRDTLRSPEMPWREVLAFTTPLFTSDLVQAALGSLDGVILGNYAGAEEVAALRAIQPVARLNQLVLTSFGLLFVPAAARYFARSDADRLHSLYWQTASWVAVLGFPIFAVTFGLAEPVSVLFFGAEYRESGTLLAILALGYFVHSSLGFNGMTLGVYGRVWHIMTSNLVVIVVTLSAQLVFIPRYGAVGAAAVTAGGLILHNVLRQWLLFRLTDVRWLDRPTMRVFSTLAGCSALLVILAILPASIYLEVAAVILTVGSVYAVARHDLNAAEVFPEVRSIPILRRLVGR